MRETWNLPGHVNRGISMTGDSRYSRRAVLVGGALLVAASLAACGPNGPEPSSTPSATAGPSVTSSPGSLRDRLVAALQTTSPTNAKLVENPQSKLTPVEADWLPGWQIIDVVSSAPPHPRRFYAALSSDGRAEVLTGKPEAFSAMLVSAGVQVDSAEVASSIGSVYLDSTRDFQYFSYRVDRIEDIQWRPRLTAAEKSERDEVLQTYRSRVKPATAVETDGGWQVTVWMVQRRNLVKHEVGIAADAAVTDHAETAVADLPVPDSI